MTGVDNNIIVEGSSVPKRRRSDVVSLQTLDLRVSALEENYHDLRRQIGDAANEVRANTRLTEEIHGEVGSIRSETAGIVEFVKRADASWKKWKERGATFRRRSKATAIYVAAISTAITGVMGAAKMTGLWP